MPEDELLNLGGGEETIEEPDVIPQKAYIMVREKCFIPASNINFENNDKIIAQLNPSDYSISVSTSFKPESLGIKQDDGTFGSHMEEVRPVLSVKLLFDSELDKKHTGTLGKIKSMFQAKSKGTGILDSDMLFGSDLEEKYLKKLKALANSVSDGKRPPQVSFIYGETDFRGFVSNLDIKYKEFGSDGAVTRAEADIKITYAPDYLMSGASGITGGLTDAGGLGAADDIIDDNPLQLI